MDRVLASRASLEGERKQVTVLFADVRGSLYVIQDVDPEEGQALLDAVLEAMADEIRHLLEEGVVAEAADVDTCLLLGAGYPFWLGGITKHLDQTGVSERVVGGPLAELGVT